MIKDKPAEISLSDKIINQEPTKWKKGYPIFHSAILVEDIKEAVQKYFEALDFNASEKRKIIEIGKAKELLKLVFGERLTNG